MRKGGRGRKDGEAGGEARQPVVGLPGRQLGAARHTFDWSSAALVQSRCRRLTVTMSVSIFESEEEVFS